MLDANNLGEQERRHHAADDWGIISPPHDWHHCGRAGGGGRACYGTMSAERGSLYVCDVCMCKGVMLVSE